MLITNHTPSLYTRQTARQATPDQAPSHSVLDDSVTLGSDDSGAWLFGGIGALGAAALGAYGGGATGLAAGLAGAVAGASAGSSLAMILPGERLKTGAIAGAIAGAIIGSSFGGLGLAIGMGTAGAMLPVGILTGPPSRE